MLVYCLYELKTLKIRYFGITSQSLKKRLYQHFYFSSKNTYKENWIKKNDSQIGIRTLKKCKTKQEAREIEIYLIRKYKDSHNLVNLQDRGFCKDKILMCKEKCKQISKTLKQKYKNKDLKVSGEKPVFVWNKSGGFVKSFRSGKQCSNNLGIPYSKIGSICNSGGYYKNYTFSRDFIIPIKNYIKCYDYKNQTLSLCFKKEDICGTLNINKFHNKYINSDKLYLQRYNVRTDNNFPPAKTGRILCNDIIYKCLENVMYSSKELLHSWRKDIAKSLKLNTVFEKNGFTIKNETCARFKFGELLETPEGFKTKEELETINLNV